MVCAQFDDIVDFLERADGGVVELLQEELDQCHTVMLALEQILEVVYVLLRLVSIHSQYILPYKRNHMTHVQWRLYGKY